MYSDPIQSTELPISVMEILAWFALLRAYYGWAMTSRVGA
jgi:hypothetical protein